MSELQKLLTEFQVSRFDNLEMTQLGELIDLLAAERRATSNPAAPEGWESTLDARIDEAAQSDPFESRAEREFDDVAKQWNKLVGVRKIRILSPKRRKLLQKRLSERAWDWKAAMAKFPLECFQDGGWTPGFDWFLKSDTVNRILEGTYDWEK